MYSKYQISKAQSISLLDCIESRGYELIYSHNEVRLKEHDSLVNRSGFQEIWEVVH